MKRTLAAVTKATITPIKNDDNRLFKLTVSNIQQIGNKKYVNMPMELMFIDEQYQRGTVTSKLKIRNLANKWNDAKMDSLKVSIHPEEGRFAIIDGMHRYKAAEIIGKTELNCEVIELSGDPKVRLVQEATLFATQMDEVDNLTPVEKHSANCLRGVIENVILQEVLDFYNIPLKTNPSHGRVKIGHLAGFTSALAIAKKNGKGRLDSIFYVITGARWDIASKGTSSLVIQSIDAMLKLHPDHEEEIKQKLIEMFKPIQPEKFFASAMDTYPERKEKERLVLYLEDKICDELNIEHVYHGGNVKEIKKTA